MSEIFKYFWFLCAAFMAINLVIWRRRLATVVARGIATQAEVDTFFRGVAAWVVGSALALGVISLVAGWTSPFCAGVLAFDTVPRCLTSVVIVAAWCALLWWVWRGSGADFLARVGPALGNRPSYDRTYSPTIVRAFVTLLVVVSAVGSSIAAQNVPMSATPGCTLPTTAG